MDDTLRDRIEKIIRTRAGHIAIELLPGFQLGKARSDYPGFLTGSPMANAEIAKHRKENSSAQN